MKNAPFWLVFIVLAFASPTRADSIDDAEAAKRGVPVLQVQLEKAQKKSAELQKQVEDLKSQISKAKDNADVAVSSANAKANADAKVQAQKLKDAEDRAAKAERELAITKSGMTDEQKKKVDAIASAMERQEPEKGMTLEQLKSIMPGNLKLASEQDGTQTYTASRQADSPVSFKVYTIDIEGGKVVNWRMVIEKRSTNRGPLPPSGVPAEEVGPGGRLVVPH